VPRPAIVFIGFMGAGKSTALAAARGAGLETTEIDELMEREFGMPIKQVFEELGESVFREREEALVGSLLENADGGAIALGGGSVLYPRVRDALSRHLVVWLEVSAAEAWRRIAHTDRPLATSEVDVSRLLAARMEHYRGLADAVVPPDDRRVIERVLPSIQALTKLPAGSKLLWAKTDSHSYPVFVGRELLRSDWWPLQSRRFGITDNQIWKWLRDRDFGFESLYELEPGEAAKSLQQTGEILSHLAQSGMRRDDHVVAVGGGVVGDLAGFCAHLYQRGVPVVQVPTTLVSQVDSAYGGKTGVDLPEGKNYAGAYHQPSAVITDPIVLESLPATELSSGFVEVLKTALLRGGNLWEEVRSMDEIRPDTMDDVIFECARYKCEVVAEDETDGGKRNVLNLGHTVGHAIETATNYAYRHGEAVGLGLLAALRLSGAGPLRDEVETILRRHSLPTVLDRKVSADLILATLQRDKKRTSKGVGFVLLSKPGEPRHGEPVPPDDVRAAVEELY
jgi:shikimate kinase/3-dehydroquinate synthase